MQTRIRISGLGSVSRMLDRLAGEGMQQDIANITETYARKMAEEAAALAPIDSGALKGSIASSPEQINEYTWQYGSNLPYATKMEYMHPTNKAFIRKSVWNNREKYRKAVKKRLLRD